MISPVSLAPVSAVSPVSLPAGPSQKSSFGQLFAHAMSTLQGSQTQANQAIQQAMTGQGSVTSAMVSMVQAESTLDAAVAVRNGVVQAYQNIMNMQLG
ncbi:MAG: flagellar hook-basal body complex protein FliE [Firmicutes bacterium]|nr:flagellar hook-basal body complex protein FliE [Bacillota bacterium]